jgi:hypothetical protein
VTEIRRSWKQYFKPELTSNTHHPEIGNSTAIQVEFKKFGNSREFKEFYNECA